MLVKHRNDQEPSEGLRRRDWIPLLVERPWTLDQLARALQIPPREIQGHLDHLLQTLRHLPYHVEWTPARCRKCGFLFRTGSLTRPSRCPQCKSTWIAPARIQLIPTDDPAHKHSTAGENSAVDSTADTVNGPQDMVDRETTSQPETPEWLEWIDHTADVGFVVRAPDLPTLFERAALALFQVLTDPSTVEPREPDSVDLEADDLAGLLVRWLSELNYLHETRHRLYSRFEIHELQETEPYRLVATAWGESIHPERHPLYTEIKAVTYHRLRLERRGDQWEAEVILDL